MEGSSIVKKKRLPAVPVSLLIKRKKQVNAKKKKIQDIVKKVSDRRVKRQQYFKRAEQYAKEYRLAEREEIKTKRAAKKEGAVIVPAEEKLAFVIRIRGVNQVPPKVRKVLKLFRLLQINNGVFVRLNKATLSMLRIAEPHISWGYPNLRSVKGLLYKRGAAMINRRRIPLTSNTMIEENIGKFGMICMEDLVHEIFTVGPCFANVCRFLAPFKLNNPRKGWRKKTVHYVEGGDFGNRENKINVLLRKMI